MAKKNKTPLTKMQQKFVKNMSKGMGRRAAARAAGYSTKNIDQSAFRALSQVTAKVPELMDELGLTDRALIQKDLVPLLKAKITKYFAHEGKVISWRNVADNNARLNALDMAFRLRGSYAPKDPKEAAQFGIKVVIVDVPRPDKNLVLPDIGPGDPLPDLDKPHKNGDGKDD